MWILYRSYFWVKVEVVCQYIIHSWQQWIKVHLYFPNCESSYQHFSRNFSTLFQLKRSFLINFTVHIPNKAILYMAWKKWSTARMDYNGELSVKSAMKISQFLVVISPVLGLLLNYFKKLLKTSSNCLQPYRLLLLVKNERILRFAAYTARLSPRI